MSVDPLTQSYPWYTPYQFAGNKPIIAIDLDGLEEEIAIFHNEETMNPAIRTVNGKFLKFVVVESSKIASKSFDVRALELALESLENGDLYTLSGRKINTSRMSTYTLFDQAGNSHKNVRRGVNVGWVYNKKFDSTKGVDQLEAFYKNSISKQAGKVLSRVAFAWDFWSLGKSIIDGEPDPFAAYPFSFLGEMHFAEIVAVHNHVFNLQLNDALKSGLKEVEKFLDNNTVANEKFQLMYMNDETLESLLKGEYETNSDLMQNLQQVRDKSARHGILTEEDTKGNTIIRSLFIDEG